jgi:hypothetical protein
VEFYQSVCPVLIPMSPAELLQAASSLTGLMTPSYLVT